MSSRKLAEQSMALEELSSVVLNMLRSPRAPMELLVDYLSSAIPIPSSSSALAPARRRVTATPISPAGFGSLMLGISLALMLCGSITFFIGFMLIPWVLGLFMVLYVIGLISVLSMAGRSILCYAASAAANASSPASSSCERIFESRSCCRYESRS